MSLPKFLVEQIQQIAQAARDEGQFVEIDSVLPSININDEYFYQEHEADALLADVPEEVTAEDWILYTSQNW